jgi:hypothetical protein
MLFFYVKNPQSSREGGKERVGKCADTEKGNSIDKSFKAEKC